MCGGVMAGMYRMNRMEIPACAGMTVVSGITGWGVGIAIERAE